MTTLTKKETQIKNALNSPGVMMTSSIWDEMVTRRDSAVDEDDESVRDPDDERPTFDEWKRYDDERREHEEMRHARDGSQFRR